MTELYIKPAPGCLVRDPRTLKPLAEEGESKPKTPFWLRRLRDGSVIKAEPAKAAVAKGPKTKPAVATQAPADVTQNKGADNVRI
jgi:hypothetical protein